MQYALARHNLGNAYGKLAEIEETADNCRLAITAFQEAFKVYTLDDFSMQYGMTQNNLGNAYGKLAEVEERCTTATWLSLPSKRHSKSSRSAGNYSIATVPMRVLPPLFGSAVRMHLWSHESISCRPCELQVTRELLLGPSRVLSTSIEKMQPKKAIVAKRASHS